MDVANRIRKARIELLKKEYTFFGVLALHLKMAEKEDLPAPAGTDGRYFYYNPKLLEKFNTDEIKFIIVHEVMHVALKHVTRIGLRDKIRWNFATDLVINHRLVKDGLSAPDGVLLDNKYGNMSAEEVYAQLPYKEIKLSGGYYICDSGYGERKFKQLDEHIKVDKEKHQQLDEDWSVEIANAATVARMRGTLPSSVEDIVNKLFKPQLNWVDYLKKFIISSLSNDYRWTPPNKKFLDSGFIFPSLQSDSLGDIVCGVDTSGSVDMERSAPQFFAEMQSILDLFDVQLHMIECDAGIQFHKIYGKGDRLDNVEFKGRGGTRFEPVFEYVEKNDIRPQCLIYFTDMYGSFPEITPNYPTLWVATTDDIAPFGETIKIDVNVTSEM